MLRALLLTLSLALLAPAAAQLPAAPDFALKSHTGENLRLSEQRGQVVILAFWATWCADCDALLERLRALAGEMDASATVIWALSIDHDRDAARRVAVDYTAAFATLLDESRTVAPDYGVQTMPSVLLIDRDGRIARRVAGAASLSFDYRAAVQELLQP